MNTDDFDEELVQNTIQPVEGLTVISDDIDVTCLPWLATPFRAEPALSS